MKKTLQRLLVDQLTRRLRGLNRADLREPPGQGWIRSIRDALGMSARQLAQRAGVTQPSVTLWEKREISGAITMASLRKAADAMQCDLVYALVPRKPLQKLIEDRAVEVAGKMIEPVSHSMALEGLQTDALRRNRLIRETARRLIEESPGRLWNE